MTVQKSVTSEKFTSYPGKLKLISLEGPEVLLHDATAEAKGHLHLQVEIASLLALSTVRQDGPVHIGINLKVKFMS